MEEYLINLKNEFEKKKIKSFWVLFDSDEFKIIKKPIDEIKRVLLKYSHKYGNRNIANVVLNIRKSGLIDNDWVLAIKIIIYHIDKNGNIDKTQSDSWGLSLKYTIDDLTNKPFQFDDIQKLVHIVNDKIVTSLIDGIYYKDFIKKLKKIKKKINN